MRSLKNRFEKAAGEKDGAVRAVKIAAVISDALSEIDIEPVLVGGAAVAFYTDGKYTTRDIDMTAPSRKDVGDVMGTLGFKKFGKDYINKALNVYVEFPSEAIGPTERYSIIKIEDTGLKIISIEDLIVDRLNSFRHWGSSVDGLNSLRLLELGLADEARLEERAREEDVLDALDHIQGVLQEVIRKKISADAASRMLERFIK